MACSGKQVLRFLCIFFLFLFLFPSSVHAENPPAVPPTTTRFLYDGDGVRVAKIENGKTTLYVGGMEKNLKTGEITKYYSLGGKTVAYKDNSGLNFLITDHLGSIRKVIDVNGNTKSELSYYPYGLIRSQAGTPPSREYTGQINDTETSLYFYNARYYNPAIGNFISADTVQESLNRYFYVSNNPLIKSDPSGHQEEDTNTYINYPNSSIIRPVFMWKYGNYYPDSDDIDWHKMSHFLNYYSSHGSYIDPSDPRIPEFQKSVLPENKETLSKKEVVLQTMKNLGNSWKHPDPLTTIGGPKNWNVVDIATTGETTPVCTYLAPVLHTILAGANIETIMISTSSHAFLAAKLGEANDEKYGDWEIIDPGNLYPDKQVVAPIGEILKNPSPLLQGQIPKTGPSFTLAIGGDPFNLLNGNESWLDFPGYFGGW